jgi:hypothetical protein
MAGEHINIGERNLAIKSDSVLSYGSDSDTVLVALAVKLDQTFLHCPSSIRDYELSEPPDIIPATHCLDGQIDHLGATVHVTDDCGSQGDKVVPGCADGGGVDQYGDGLERYQLSDKERGVNTTSNYHSNPFKFLSF